MSMSENVKKIAEQATRMMNEGDYLKASNRFGSAADAAAAESAPGEVVKAFRMQEHLSSGFYQLAALRNPRAAKACFQLSLEFVDGIDLHRSTLAKAMLHAVSAQSALLEDRVDLVLVEEEFSAARRCFEALHGSAAEGNTRWQKHVVAIGIELRILRAEKHSSAGDQVRAMAEISKARSEVEMEFGDEPESSQLRWYRHYLDLVVAMQGNLRALLLLGDMKIDRAKLLFIEVVGKAKLLVEGEVGMSRADLRETKGASLALTSIASAGEQECVGWSCLLSGRRMDGLESLNGAIDLYRNAIGRSANIGPMGIRLANLSLLRIAQLESLLEESRRSEVGDITAVTVNVDRLA